MLFLVAFDDIIEEIRKTGSETYAYADDLAATGQGMKKLEEVIKICENWTINNKMKINKLKSGVIIHRKEHSK